MVDCCKIPKIVLKEVFDPLRTLVFHKNLQRLFILLRHASQLGHTISQK